MRFAFGFVGFSCLYADLLVKSPSIALIADPVFQYHSMNGFLRILADENRESTEPSCRLDRLGLKRHRSGELIVVVLPENLFNFCAWILELWVRKALFLSTASHCSADG